VTHAEEGQALLGVSVTGKGTNMGTITDSLGQYALTLPEEVQIMVFSYVGMETQEVAVNGRISINVQLQIQQQEIDELLVIAYGTSQKSSFTGSAENLGKDKMEHIQANSVTKFLEGALAGVQASSASGQPGSHADIRIRGIGSINASSAPIYVLDGMVYVGDLNAINPADIESVTVLKDAAAGALYGARGANGVIVITSKKGEAGKMQLEVRANLGWSDKAMEEYPRLNPGQFYEKSWEARRNSLVYGSGYTIEEANQIASYGQDADGKSINTIAQLGNYNAYNVNPTLLIGTKGKLNPDASLLWTDDWEEELYRMAFRQDYHVNLKGESHKSKYFISLGYLDEEGIVEYSNLKRFTGRVGVESQVIKWLAMGLSANTSTYTTNNFNFENDYEPPYSKVRYFGTIYPVYAYYTWNQSHAGTMIADTNGNPFYDFGSGELTFDDGYGQTVKGRRKAITNPIAHLRLDESSTQADAVNARTYIELTFFPGFQFRTNLGLDYGSTNGKTYMNSIYGATAVNNGLIARENSRTLAITFNQLLTFHRTIGRQVVIALAGHESYSFQSNFLYARRIGFPFEGIRELAPAATGAGSNSYENNDRIESYVGRINYGYADKYYISASIRQDGSSRFQPEMRWGTFWSVGVGWRISEEKFLRTNWINNLKLKASYGIQGNNEGIGFYPSQNLYSYRPDDETTYDNNIYPGALATSLELSSLIWEKNAHLNAGIEFALLKSLRGSVEYFVRGSDNLLFQVPQPRSLGIDTKWENIGTMMNRGIEALLSLDLISGVDFHWNLDFNITHYKNEITRLPQEEIIAGTRKLKVGKSVYDFFIREYAGADAESGEALYWMDEIEEDAEGNDVIGEDGKPVKTGKRLLIDGSKAGGDRYYLGSSIPDFYGGITNTFTYKGFDLSVFVSYSVGGEVLDFSYRTLIRANDPGVAIHSDILNNWTEPLHTDGLPTGEKTDGTDVTDIFYDPGLIPRVDFAFSDLANIPGKYSSRYMFDASYFNIRNMTLGYNLPKNLAKRIGADGLRLYLTVDNLFIWSANPGMNPLQGFGGIIGGYYPTERTYTIGVNLSL
jgi:TonB-linked SusC/RagA family outer membrane protein